MGETNFIDAIPIIAAILGPMLGFMFYSLRVHHKDNLETRELIHRTNSDTRESLTELIHRTNAETTKNLTELIIRTNQETRDAAKRDHEELKKDHNELKRLVTKITDSLDDVREQLTRVRERLAGIEGHLGLGRWAKPDETIDPETATV